MTDAIHQTPARTDAGRPTRTPTFSMGVGPSAPSDKALRLAAEVEDEELAGKLTP